jgi:hypothetical protein
LHIELEQVDTEVQLGSGSISPNSSGWYKNKLINLTCAVCRV